MASIYDSWKKKYSESEYEIKVSEYKEKQRTKAIAARDGIARDTRITVTCTKCGDTFKGPGNALICHKCKTTGYLETCKHCNSTFLKVHRSGKCCDDCIKLQPWKRVKRSETSKLKIKKSKQLWYQTDTGKAFKKKIASINSEKMIAFNKTERGKENIRMKAEKLSVIMKEKIANGIFTPCITNTRTHWNAKIILDTGKVCKFRSSWEATFWASNSYLEYETIRIPWLDLEGKSHTYIPDFYDVENNIIFEIKPRSQYLVQDGKMQAAIKYCLDNNIKFIWINEMNILNYINQDLEIYLHPENRKQLNKVINAVTKNKNKIN